MATSLRDLMDNPELIEALRMPSPKCIYCGSDEMPHPDEESIILGMKTTGKICADCYYQRLGEEIESIQNSYFSN